MNSSKIELDDNTIKDNIKYAQRITDAILKHLSDCEDCHLKDILQEALLEDE